MLRPLLPLLTLALAAQAPDPYRASVDAWHAAREARLAAEDGWLTLIGRDWLKPGANALGSDPAAEVRLPAWAAPAKAGTFILEGGKVRFRPVPGAGILLNGAPATEAVLRTDAQGKPDQLRSGRVVMFLIQRGERVAVRIKDPENPARKQFHGVPRYPVDPAWRVEATFEPYATPKVRAIPTVLGTTEPMTAPGLLRFRLAGKERTLEPLLDDPDHPELFIIFRDPTSASGTYPSGRFLYAAMPRDGKVVLDFNQAINPPCAFTLFATCPLPPPQNLLDIPIPAGEKDPGMH